MRVSRKLRVTTTQRQTLTKRISPARKAGKKVGGTVGAVGVAFLPCRSTTVHDCPEGDLANKFHASVDDILSVARALGLQQIRKLGAVEFFSIIQQLQGLKDAKNSISQT